MTTTLKFELGTLVLDPPQSSLGEALPGFQFDTRTKAWRAPAYYYRDIILEALRTKMDLVDKARDYQALPVDLKQTIVPRDHQDKALSAWNAKSSRGVVCLPTGAGKTILAVMAIAKTKRPTLVVVPTIDLLLQWQTVLQKYFDTPIGLLGGGWKSLEAISVATYDTASLMVEMIGNKFGLMIFDECHHLPANQYQLVAKASIAPFRLGLSATVERADGREELLYEIVGDLCYEGQIREMVANVLSPYDVVSIEVPLTDEEKTRYQLARGIYTKFLRSAGVDFSSPDGWKNFMRKAAIMPGGKAAMDAYREQKSLAQSGEGKIRELWRILQAHPGERIIVFTNDNATAYHIGKQYVLPVLTHLTKPKERKKMLEYFRSGAIDVLVTSKVLNEGVDVPEASIGVVISGSGAVREHVQRLGRILRHQEGKRATLYEVLSKDTGEIHINNRRRNHHAYQGPSQVQRTNG
ncbi:MAG: DEAD/DEAH box helicase [Proteobacteria bacterium]|nr:MAG: DEAD/DEAH box helicase [Pseudomonadota bacterium]